MPGQIAAGTVSDGQARQLRDRLAEYRGAANTPSMSAIADVMDVAVELGFVDKSEPVCAYCGTGETGCAMAGPMTVVDGVPYHVDGCAAAVG